MKFEFTANEKLYLSFSMWDRTVQNNSLLEKKASFHGKQRSLNQSAGRMESDELERVRESSLR